MSTIQFNGVGMADLQSRINELNQASKDMQISATRDSSNNVVITVVSGGKSYQIPNAVSLPDIDRPKDDSCTEELDKVIEMIEKFCEELEAQAKGETPPAGDKGALERLNNISFDLYEAIALLKKTAQEERQRKQEMRKQMSMQLSESMLDEAAMITKNADSAYNNAMALQIASTVTSCAAFCTTLGSSIAQGVMVKQSEAQNVKGQINEFKGAAKEMAAANKQMLAEQKRAEAQPKAGPQQSEPQNIELVEIKEESGSINDFSVDLDDEPVNQPVVENQVEGGKVECPESMPKSKEAALNTAVKQNDLAEAKNDLKSAQQELSEALQGGDSKAISAAEEKVEAKTEAVKAAEAKYAKAMKDETKVMKEEMAGMDKSSPEYKVAEKYQQQRLAEMNGEMKACLNSALKGLRMDYDMRIKGVMNSRGFQQTQNVINATNQAFQAVNAGMQMIQASQDKAAAYVRAGEKRMEAGQESLRKDIDIINEGIRHDTDIINDCKELLKAISDSEKQVMGAINSKI